MDDLYDFLVLPFVEIEIRLGTILKDKFDSCIDKKYFEKIKETLESGEWESIINKNTVEYCKNDTFKNVLKYITDTSSKNPESIFVLKEKVHTEDFQFVSSPFDIRYSINQEFSLNKESFSKNNFRF